MYQTDFTEHARVRMQQRGIPDVVLERLYRYGRTVHDHRGARILHFDHAARKRMQRELDRADYCQLEKHLNAYAVLDMEGTVITVGHRIRRVRHH